MVIDWFVMLTPLLLLVLLVPWVFMGCGLNAVGSKPTGGGAALLFDGAIRVEFDPLPTGVSHVDGRPIISITVQWTLTGNQSSPNPLSVKLPVQIKGSTVEPLTSRDTPFYLDVGALDYASEVRLIHCQCDVKFEQGQYTTMENTRTSLSYTPGATRLFRLKRGTLAYPLPGVPQKEDPFFVVPEMGSG